MAQAICIECGTMKRGALTPCPSCGFQPRDTEEQAKAMMLTETVLRRGQLAELADRRQRGEPWNFDRKIVELFKARIEALGRQTESRHVQEQDGD